MHLCPSGKLCSEMHSNNSLLKFECSPKSEPLKITVLVVLIWGLAMQSSAFPAQIRYSKDVQDALSLHTQTAGAV